MTYIEASGPMRRMPPATSDLPRSGSRTGAGTDSPLVLLVDDVEDNLDLYETIFVHEGFRVALAHDGVDALERAKELAPDVIVMDLSMPVLDGWEATRRIRTELGLSKSYIIALSGYADVKSRSRALEVGCDEFVAKPCIPRELVALVRAALRGDR